LIGGQNESGNVRNSFRSKGCFFVRVLIVQIVVPRLFKLIDYGTIPASREEKKRQKQMGWIAQANAHSNNVKKMRKQVVPSFTVP